jgi:hypothetical protein
MIGLQAVYSQAIANNRARASQYFYEAHHRLIGKYAKAYSLPMVNACIAFSRLSPRTSIQQNLKAFINLLAGNPKPQSILSANWQSAREALSLSEEQAYDYLYNQPLSKVRAFARNLLLDGSVITLDAIMARILKDYYPIPTLSHLFQHYSEWHTRIYPAIQELEPAIPAYQIQAILWTFARRVYSPIPKGASLLSENSQNSQYSQAKTGAR